MRDRSRPFHADQEGRRQEIGFPGDAALAHCPMPGPPPRHEERDLHPFRKTAAAHEKPTASVLSQRRRHPSRRVSMKSTHESIYERPTRSAGHRPSSRPRLVRLGWSVAGLAALAFIAAACTGGGSSSSGAGSYGAAPTTSSGSPSAAIVDLRGSKLG